MLFMAEYSFADAGDQAIRKAGQAAIKHFGIDKMARRFEKRYIHEDIRTYGGYTVSLADIIIKQRVVLKWKF